MYLHNFNGSQKWWSRIHDVTKLRPQKVVVIQQVCQLFIERCEESLQRFARFIWRRLCFDGGFKYFSVLSASDFSKKILCAFWIRIDSKKWYNFLVDDVNKKHKKRVLTDAPSRQSPKHKAKCYSEDSTGALRRVVTYPSIPVHCCWLQNRSRR